MGLLNETASQYYTGIQGYFVATTGTQTITLTFDPLPELKSEIRVYVDGVELDPSFYTYTSPVVTTLSSVASGSNIEVQNVFFKTGKYQFTTLEDIVNNFMIAYVGNGKLIDDVRRSEVLFHCKRAIQEFSYDISRVEKIQEIELGPTLVMPMPQDYVNYVRLSWVDESGIENTIFPFRHTSKPNTPILQANDYSYLFDNEGNLLLGDSVTYDRFTSINSSELNMSTNAAYFMGANYDVERETFLGGRYGLNPENPIGGAFFLINDNEGNISFSSNLSGKVITLKYISDGLGTDGEMRIHKFAEEAIYKHVALNILSSKINTPEYVINRFKKEKRAAIHNTKIRLYNIKQAEIINTMRVKSKHIKH